MLTPEQTSYVLADSRADALVVSAPLLAALRPALATLPELRLIIVAAPDGTRPDLAEGDNAFEDFLGGDRTDLAPVETSPDEVAFWLYSSGPDRTAQRGEARPRQSSGDGRHLRRPGARHPSRRSDVLGGKTVLRLWARQFYDLSDVGRRRRGAAAGPPDAGRRAGGHAARPPDDLRRRPDTCARHLSASVAAGGADCFAAASRPARRCPKASGSAGGTPSAPISWMDWVHPRMQRYFRLQPP